MRTIWQSLAWKEWHEHKWKLATLAALLCGIGIATSFGGRVQEDLPGLWMLCMLPAAIFLGLEAAASEASRGTLPFLQALPLARWWAAGANLAAGLATLFVAMLLAVGLMYLWSLAAFFLETDAVSGEPAATANAWAAEWFVSVPLMLLTVSTSMFLWTAATGTRRRDEISAAAVALACILGIWVAILAGRTAFDYYTNAHEPLWLRTLALAIAPGGYVALIPLQTPTSYLAAGAVLAIVFHLGLAVWFLRRFGREAEATIRSPRPAAVQPTKYFAKPPRRSQFAAIAWKQFRESMPIVLVGLGGAAAIVALAMVVAVLQNASGERTDYSEWFGHIVLVASIIFGLMVAIVAGMGAYLFDLGDGLSTFWRSRPISIDLWFWTKFFTGLVLVIVAFQVPMLLGQFMDSPKNDPGFRQSFALIWQITAYSTAAAGICLVRRPVYAVILGLATLYIAWATCATILGSLFDVMAKVDDYSALAAVGLGTYSLVAALVAWLAVRYDWSWKLERF